MQTGPPEPTMHPDPVWSFLLYLLFLQYAVRPIDWNNHPLHLQASPVAELEHWRCSWPVECCCILSISCSTSADQPSAFDRPPVGAPLVAVGTSTTWWNVGNMEENKAPAKMAIWTEKIWSVQMVNFKTHGGSPCPELHHWYKICDHLGHLPSNSELIPQFPISVGNPSNVGFKQNLQDTGFSQWNNKLEVNHPAKLLAFLW